MTAHPPEIIGLGVSTIDELIVLEHHPRISEKQKILSRSRQCGGLTGSALVAASRMGCRCGYLIALGVGELSNFLRESMAAEGISLYEDTRYPETEPYLAIILSDGNTGDRSVLWDNSRSRAPRLDEYERQLIFSARCLFVDHIYASAIVDVVEEAREGGIEVVGDFERFTPDSPRLMNATNHIILPLAFARQVYDEKTGVKEMVTALASTPGRTLACITDGTNGAWYALGDKPESVLHQSAFIMENPVDTTGCGDVFHGIYMAGIVRGFPLNECIQRAAAAAALKTRHRGAQAGAPGAAALQQFLDSRLCV